MVISRITTASPHKVRATTIRTKISTNPVGPENGEGTTRATEEINIADTTLGMVTTTHTGIRTKRLVIHSTRLILLMGTPTLDTKVLEVAGPPTLTKLAKVREEHTTKATNREATTIQAVRAITKARTGMAIPKEVTTTSRTTTGDKGWDGFLRAGRSSEHDRSKQVA